MNLEEITNRLGVKFRNINMHELFDQLKQVDPYTNPTTPGRKGHNINEEDVKLAEKLLMNSLPTQKKCAWNGTQS